MFMWFFCGLTLASKVPSKESVLKLWFQGEVQFSRLKLTVLVLLRARDFSEVKTQETSYHFNASFLRRLQPLAPFLRCSH